MDCEKFRSLLDAYIDGEIAGEEKRQFMDHADACENCRMELREAEMLRDMMKDLDDGIAVPLPVQAAWRNAVKQEAKKIRMRRAMKFAYAAAAALLVVVGSTVGFNALNEKNNAAPEMQPMMLRSAVEMETEELIAVDGAADVSATAESAAYTAVKKIESENSGEACKTVELLCTEYTGSFTAQMENGIFSYQIELPYEYMPDFLNAMSHIGTELESQISDSASETALILIQICEK